MNNWDSVIDEALINSDIPPKLISRMRAILTEYYSSKIIAVYDDYPPAAQHLYSFDDNQFYSVVCFCYTDSYDFVLIRTEDLKVKTMLGEFIRIIKDEFGLSGQALGDMVKTLYSFWHPLMDVFYSSTKTNRLSQSAGSRPEPELPDMETMKVFYECGRKAVYASPEEAAQVLSNGNEVYQCDHCRLWHQGKKPTGMVVPQHIMEGRYRTVWRRTKNV